MSETQGNAKTGVFERIRGLMPGTRKNESGASARANQGGRQQGAGFFFTDTMNQRGGSEHAGQAANRQTAGRPGAMQSARAFFNRYSKFGLPVLLAIIGIALVAGIMSVVDFAGGPSRQTASVKEPAIADAGLFRDSRDASDSVAPSIAGRGAESPEAVEPQRTRSSAAQDDLPDGSDWIRSLSKRQIARYYPPRAEEKGIEGVAILRCRFGSRPNPDCRLMRETPQGWRFGDAAQRLSRRFRASEEAIPGRPFSVTVRFEMG